MDIMDIADDILHGLTLSGLTTGELLDKLAPKYSSPHVMNVIAEMGKLKLIELRDDKWVVIASEHDLDRWFQQIEDEETNGRLEQIYEARRRLPERPR